MAGILKQLSSFGQSVWFDDINRDALLSGKLRELVEDYNVTGGTSNPTIFEKAFSATGAYDEQFDELGKDFSVPEKIQDILALTDVQMAADLFREACEKSGGVDGYASLEVSPAFAHDTEKTQSEVRRLFTALDRPNVMIKIPGTPAGIPAIETCLSEGINVNITLLFSVANYERVMEAYLSALERRLATSQRIDNIASVASFFVSRVDTMADERLEELAERKPEMREEIVSLRGKVGIANAKLAYQRFLEVTSSERWRKLAEAGAQLQRPLWASTSTKNPDYSDVMYVDGLIGPNTVNTMPEETIGAFDDHGAPAERLTEGIDEAREVIAGAERAGLDMTALTNDLQREGVEKFLASYKDAIAAIVERLSPVRA